MTFLHPSAVAHCFGFLLLLAHSTCAVTVYSAGATKTTPTATTLPSFVPGSTYSGPLAYNPTTLQAPAVPTGFSTQVSVQVLGGAAPPGSSIPTLSSLFGFSIEMSVANQVLGRGSTLLNVPFLNLMANLVKRSGRVNVRVGGNTQETATLVQNTTSGRLLEKDYNNTLGTTNSPPIVYKEDLIYMMANISSHTNVRWFLGIPFNSSSPYQLAIAERGQAILGDYLIGLQAGNEPDFYAQFGKRPANYSVYDYFGEIGALVNQMNNDPLIFNRSMLLAPSVATGNWPPEEVWNTNFIPTYSQYLAYLAVEHYPSNNCGAQFGKGDVIDPQSMLPNYLTHDAVTGLLAPYLNSTNIAQQSNKPFVMFETNTASCGGFPGISDAFAAALWGVDYGLQMAYSNFSYGMFHIGGQDVCYNAFTAPPTNQSSYLQWTVGSMYYSALAMAETLTNGSQVLDITSSANLNHQSPAYVIYENGQPSRIAVINYVSDPSGASDIQFTFSIGGQSVGQSNGTPAQVKVKYLRASSVTQKYNYTWAGQTFGGFFESDGRPIGDENIQTIQCNQGSNSCAVTVPAPSYALIFLSDQTLSESENGPYTTFATTTSKTKTALTVDPSVLATSNGHSGLSLEELASTSKGSLSAAVGMAEALESAVTLGCLAAAALTVFRSMGWLW
ncbi:hypothetical protein AX15_006061 [Amanita polypyramis BW_CC]|nr:hypothetical protein AX15_006061 [Amanita polypyramis BW_CC]